MKKITAFIFSILFSVSLLAQPVEIPSFTMIGFFGTPWNANRDFVIKKYNGELNSKGDVVAGFKYQGTATVFVFEFKDNKLIKVQTLTKTALDKPIAIAEFCDYTAMSIVSKYGEPIGYMDQHYGAILEWSNKETKMQLACDTQPPGAVMMVIQKK